MRFFTILIALIITTSSSAQVFVEPCMDLEEIDFGFCDMAMEITVVGGECVYVSGCGWEVGGVNSSPAFYTSFESCEEGCLETLDCVDFSGLYFGEYL